MSEDLDAVQVAVLVARAIERVGGRYFIGGSLASSIDGEPRATNDIDVVLDLPIGRIAQLRDGGEVSEKQWRDVVGVIRHAGSGSAADGHTPLTQPQD